MKTKQKLFKPVVVLTILALVLALLPASTATVQAASTSIVISQVYGGGGGSGYYLYDYVELFNLSASTVDLSGWSVQYGSAAGNFASSSANLYAFPAGTTITSGKYLLVQLGAAGGSGSALPVTPDLSTGNLSMSQASGKVALANIAISLGCGATATLCTLPDSRIVDLASYGAANNGEGGTTINSGTALTNQQGGVRKLAGCQDTDNNSTDFEVLAGVLLIPRNGLTPAHTCGGPTSPSGVGAASPNTVFLGGTTLLTVSVTPGTNPISTGLTVTGNLSSIGGSTTQAFYDDGSHGDVTAGDNIFSYEAVVAATPVTCSRSIPISILDAEARTGSAAITLKTIYGPAVIHDIQGASHISPLNNACVTNVSGIVTAKRSNGFYMQDPNPDSDPATSEGIFVFTSSAPNAILVGDNVSVSASVSEYRSGGATSTNLTLTELVSPVVVVNSNGNPLPAPTVIGIGGRVPPAQYIESDATGNVETSGVFNPDTDGIDFFESLEGMYVQVNDAVAVGPTSFFSGAAPNREIPVLADNGANIAPGLRTPRGGIVIQPGNFNPERIILNDAISGPTLPAANVNDSFPGATTGVIDYSFGNYKLEVTSMPAMVSGGLTREEAAIPVGKQLSVAAFNVENLAPSDPLAKFTTLAELIVKNLKSPDLISIEEVQDNSGALDNGMVAADTTWSNLISAIQSAGGPVYQYRQIDPVNNQDGGAPGSNIRQGFLFRTDRGLSFVDRAGGDSSVSNAVVGSGAGTQLLYSPGRIDPNNIAFKDSRKPLAGEFNFMGDKVFVIANHWNSKGGDDPLFGRYQPPTFITEVQRAQQAQVVHDFTTALLTADPEANVVVMGDLNDFQFSNALTIVKGDLLENLIDTLPAEQRYSYVYQGNSEVLDHILVSANPFSRPFTYGVVHVNAEFNDQASDHEPQAANLSVIHYETSLAPAADAKSGNPGANVQYTLTLTNTGRVADSYTLSLDAPSPLWTTVVNPVTVENLAPGASTDVTVTVSVPAGAAGLATDVAKVVAVSQGDASRSDVSTLTTTANIVYGVTLTPSADAKSADPTNTVRYTLLVTNTGNASDSFTFSLAAPLPAWTTAIETTSVPNLAAGSSASITVSTTVPLGAGGGDTSIANVKVVSAGDASKNAVSVLTTTANTIHSVSISPPVDAKSANPGATASYYFLVTNTGNATDSFAFSSSIVSGESWTPSVPLTPLALVRGASQTITVTVPIPAGAAGYADSHAAITVTSQIAPLASATTHITTTANAVRSLTLFAATDAWSGDPGMTVQYTLTLHNTGNAADTFNLSIANTPAWASVILPPTGIDLSAGDEATVLVNVTIPAGTLAGTSDTVTIQAASLGDPTKKQTASLTTTANVVRGVDVTPLADAKTAIIGHTVVYTLEVKNTGNAADTFNVSFESMGVWSTTILPVTITNLAPGATATFTVTVVIPLTAQHQQTDVSVIRVASAGNPARTVTTQLTTGAVRLFIFIPIITQ